MGPRAAKFMDMEFLPGIVTNTTPRDSRGRWVDCNMVRFHKGLPEKMAGWEYQQLTGSNEGEYIGVARAVHDWASLDGQQWIAIGTHKKLYLVSHGKLYDITPLRMTRNLVDAFTTTNGSPIVTITDPDHRAEPGDYITVIGATAVGGITLDGPYEIATVTGVNTYTVVAANNANANATGGGSVSIEYDIHIGLPENGELLGYGTGPYGMGTYGTPRPVGSGLPGQMRIWSLDNWGEDLVASPSGGTLYWWDRNNGPNSRAIAVAQAPSSMQRMLVNPENRFLISLGCTGLDDTPDKMRVRWCKQEDFSEWIPSDSNSAGGKRLDYGSQLITGIRTRGQIMLWSDTQLYGMQFVDAPFYFGFQPLGACSIIGPNAAVDVNGTVYFMGFDDIFIYDGTLRVLPCEIWTRIFGEDGIDRTQAEKCFCSSYIKKSEVRWDYEDAQGNGHYAIYNYAENAWYYGDMDRTAYHDVSRAITGYMEHPYGLNDGLLYKHETGFDEVEPDGTNVMQWHLQSHDFGSTSSDKHILIHSLIPDFDRIEGDMLVSVLSKRFPNSQERVRGPYALNPDTQRIDLRCRGSQVALLLENGADYGQDFRMDTWQVKASLYGAR